MVPRRSRRLRLLQHPPGGVPARRAHDPSARMGGGPAHKEVANRGRVARPAGRRTQEEELLERQLTLEDVPFRQSPFALEVERRDDLTVKDEVLEVRRVLRERV